MKKIIGTCCLSIVLIFLFQAQTPIQPVTTQEKVEALLAKMTLEEKVGQMAQVTLDVITKGKNEYVSDEPLQLDMALVRKALVKPKARKKTKPTQASKEERLKEKKRRGDIKKMRQERGGV